MVGVLKEKNIDVAWGVAWKQDMTAYTTIPDHIQSTTQGMTRAICVDEHLHRVIGSNSCSPD
ncbi:hypothetical protein HKD37_12G034446 [Glycine soja]|nr:hypothetical protein GmHk_12G035137 [Glycine max]